MLVALSAQRHPLRFQNFLHARQARSDHRVVQRFADHARQVHPQLSSRDFPSILALGTLVHGGLLLLPNPIFRSGEECRHSNLNDPQDIAKREETTSLEVAHFYGGKLAQFYSVANNRVALYAAMRKLLAAIYSVAKYRRPFVPFLDPVVVPGETLEQQLIFVTVFPAIRTLGALYRR